MVDIFFDLEQVLRSKREQLTLQEANILMASKARAKRDFYVGIGSGSVVTWLATQRLRNPLRSTFTLGAGAACGVWFITRSVESSVEHILSLEGSRIQRELANVMLKKHHNDPWVQRRLSKHFYSEEVYDDSAVDRPILRWRYRNFFGDTVTRPQSTPYSEETDPKENIISKTAMEPKLVYANDAVENPFDLIFGLAESAEDVPQPKTPTTSSRRQTRREKRSHRRHRHHHQDESNI